MECHNTINDEIETIQVEHRLSGSSDQPADVMLRRLI